jgi:hypothetical protein
MRDDERLIERLTKLYAQLGSTEKNYDADAVADAITALTNQPTAQVTPALPTEAITDEMREAGWNYLRSVKSKTHIDVDAFYLAMLTTAPRETEGQPEGQLR